MLWHKAWHEEQGSPCSPGAPLLPRARALCAEVRLPEGASGEGPHVLQQHSACREFIPATSRVHAPRRHEPACWGDARVWGAAHSEMHLHCCAPGILRSQMATGCFDGLRYTESFCCPLSLENGNDQLIPHSTAQWPYLVVRLRGFVATLYQSTGVFWPKMIPTTLWIGGMLLARWIDSCVGDGWRGADVLEVAAGLGLPSLVAALHGANVTVTDVSPRAVRLARLSFERNGLGGVGRMLVRSWKQQPPGRFDVILCSVPTSRNAGNLADEDREYLGRHVEFALRTCGVIVVAGGHLPTFKESRRPKLKLLGQSGPNERNMTVTIWGRAGCGQLGSIWGRFSDGTACL